MKFSERTSTILKNFALINQSVIFKPGKELKTISPSKTVLAIANIEDEIPSKAIIFDINRLLSVASLVSSEPDYEFGEKSFTITDGSKKTRYGYADESMVISPPDKEIKIPDPDVEVSVKWDELNTVIKACSVLQLPEIAFIGDEGKLYLRTYNSENPKTDSFGIELGTTDDTFVLIIKTENLKVLPQDYKVSLSSKGISRFESNDIKYFIAVDSKSSYKKG